jgi:hypothetical protein
MVAVSCDQGGSVDISADPKMTSRKQKVMYVEGEEKWRLGVVGPRAQCDSST